ncbi:MAG: alpha/beta fold hydrolase [Gemmatimonadetes bacterium]|nr:alpha/beta fold hydrolase [Gemmatimonadota bacterium]
MPYEVRPFRPAWWLPGRHAQTLGGRFLRRAPGLAVQRQRWELPDGDFLDLDFVGFDIPSEVRGRRRTPVVVILHGLEGSSRRSYVRVMLKELLGIGLRAIALNFRGCSGELNRAARFYHSGDTGDLAFVIERLREQLPDTRIGLLGYSLGGNVVLKFLGQRRNAVKEWVHAAAAISVPFDLIAGSRALERGPMARLYTLYFMRMLQRKVRGKARQLAELCDTRRALAARTLWEFDDALTAPLHGFADAEDYYTRSSCGAFLDGVRVPTLLIHSRDDPFLPAAHIPERAIAGNPCLIPAIADRGGHVGFIAGARPWAPVSWAETEAARFLSAQLDR